MSEYFEAELFRDASIAFDLDGTLVDTAPDIVRALNAVVQPHGIDHVHVEDVRAMVGRGARALIVRAFAREDRVVADAEADAMTARLIEVYLEDVAGDSVPFPGVIETLERLRGAGADLSVCTNKPSEISDRLLEALSMEGLFSRVIGPERTTAKKPAADHVFTALGDGYQRCAMVGDSAPDVDSARAAQVPSIVMTYGYSENPAGSLGADRVLDHFSDVPGALAQIWRAS